MKSRQSIQYGTGQPHDSSAGFSLIELLIVVAVILIIAGIAIPNYMSSKMRANESAAAQSLRNISTAELIYSTTYGLDYSNTLAALGGDGSAPSHTQAGLIDQTLAATGFKSGYVFTYIVLTTDPQGNASTYSVNADPQVANQTGQTHFYSDQTCVIRSNSSVPAGPGDPPLS